MYEDAETILPDGRIDEGMVRMKAFLKQMERHFIMMETLLFPTLEDTTGMRQGPTQVMRMEHHQMRGVMTAIKDTIINGVKEPVFENGETQLILTQQHKMKE